MKENPTRDDGSRRCDRGRRRLCQIAAGGMGVVTIGTVGYPILTFLKLPKSLRPRETMEVDLLDLREGTAVWGQHMGRQIVVVKTNGVTRVFDGACPHLGCIVRWDEPSLTFKCPCHGAAFSGTGAPIKGPVNSPLTSIEFKIQDDVLTVS